MVTNLEFLNNLPIGCPVTIQKSGMGFSGTCIGGKTKITHKDRYTHANAVGYRVDTSTFEGSCNGKTNSHDGYHGAQSFAVDLADFSFPFLVKMKIIGPQVKVLSGEETSGNIRLTSESGVTFYLTEVSEISETSLAELLAEKPVESPKPGSTADAPLNSKQKAGYWVSSEGKIYFKLKDLDKTFLLEVKSVEDSSSISLVKLKLSISFLQSLKLYEEFEFSDFQCRFTEIIRKTTGGRFCFIESDPNTLRSFLLNQTGIVGAVKKSLTEDTVTNINTTPIYIKAADAYHILQFQDSDLTTGRVSFVLSPRSSNQLVLEKGWFNMEAFNALNDVVIYPNNNQFKLALAAATEGLTYDKYALLSWAQNLQSDAKRGVLYEPVQEVVEFLVNRGLPIPKEQVGEPISLEKLSYKPLPEVFMFGDDPCLFLKQFDDQTVHALRLNPSEEVPPLLVLHKGVFDPVQTTERDFLACFRSLSIKKQWHCYLVAKNYDNEFYANVEQSVTTNTTEGLYRNVWAFMAASCFYVAAPVRNQPTSSKVLRCSADSTSWQLCPMFEIPEGIGNFTTDSMRIITEKAGLPMFFDHLSLSQLNSLKDQVREADFVGDSSVRAALTEYIRQTYPQEDAPQDDTQKQEEACQVEDADDSDCPEISLLDPAKFYTSTHKPDTVFGSESSTIFSDSPSVSRTLFTLKRKR
jgi:hypothetical protein